MSPALASNAELSFLAVLTVLLIASVLAVIRQPPWTPPPPSAEPPRYPAETPAPMDWGARRPPGGPLPGWDRPAEPVAAAGRHASGPVREALPVRDRLPDRETLPVRSPGRSGWTAPVAGRPGGGPPASADSAWRPPPSGGPPWDPAPRPPRAAEPQ
jgi:hypothetical protein